MDIFEWAEKYSPHFLRAFERSKTPFETLVPGTSLITLRSGFSGPEGVIRIVRSGVLTDGAGNCYVELAQPHASENPNISLLYEESGRDGPWYFSVAVIQDAAAYLAMSRLRRTEWEIDHIGKPIERLGSYPLTSIAGRDR